MEQTEYLEKNVFFDLENRNDGADKDTAHHFSVSDFQKVLQRVEHLGIGIYQMESWLNGEVYAVTTHLDLKKKATDARWYKKAFKTFTASKEGLDYAATYKVSPKLLARKNTSDFNQDNK